MIPEFRVPENYIPGTFVSVIIPARNEEANIENVLECLLRQNYPSHLLDIVVVDDASTDHTVDLVKSFEEKGVRLLQFDPGPGVIAFKKSAIEFAVDHCSSTLIITTDADCMMNENWVRTIAAFQFYHKACLISGPVLISPVRNIFQKMQALEFAGLIGIGASALQQKHPNMCNGANLAYLKAAFQAVQGYRGNENIPSGDDEFLMHKIFNEFPGRTLFIKSRDAVVSTAPSKGILEFINQRMRWVSKSTKYTNKKITLILIASYLFNLVLLINFIGMFFYSPFIWLFLLQVSLKITTEGIFLAKLTRFFKIYKIMIWLIPEQLFHILYVVIIGIAGNVKSYRWKDRKLK